MLPRALALAGVIAAAALAGCGTSERERDVTAVTERFHAALAAGDGAAACEELSEETASKLESQEERPCAEAILELELPRGGSVAFARVDVRSALAALAEGATTFLDEGSDGWKVSAAGCRETAPDQPYECTLEG